MDSLGKISFSLIFRTETVGNEREKSPDNYTPFEKLVPRNLKKNLLTPQARIRLILKNLTSHASTSDAKRLLGLLRNAVRQEQEAIERYQAKQQENRPARPSTLESSPSAKLAISVILLGEAVDNCLAALHEGSRSDFEQAVAELEKSLQNHERIMEAVVAVGETEGWVLLQRFNGPFTPLIGILGWGITMHFAGLIPERNFAKLLDMAENEMESLFQSFRPNLFFIFSWKQAETEARNAFKMMRAALINRESLSSGVIDPTSLRAALGAMAKALCHLNVMAACFHSEKSREVSAFSGKGNGHRLEIPSAFYVEANPFSAN